MPGTPASDFPGELVRQRIFRLRNRNPWGPAGQNGALSQSVSNSALQAILRPAGVQDHSALSPTSKSEEKNRVSTTVQQGEDAVSSSDGQQSPFLPPVLGGESGLLVSAP